MSSAESQTTTFNHPNDLKIVIIGGGICGVACSIALKKFGVDAHLYEAAVCLFVVMFQDSLSLTLTFIEQAKFGEVGAGLGVGTSH